MPLDKVYLIGAYIGTKPLLKNNTFLDWETRLQPHTNTDVLDISNEWFCIWYKFQHNYSGTIRVVIKRKTDHDGNPYKHTGCNNCSRFRLLFYENISSVWKEWCFRTFTPPAIWQHNLLGDNGTHHYRTQKGGCWKCWIISGCLDLFF